MKARPWPFRKMIISLIVFNAVTWLAAAYVWLVVV